MNSSFDKRLLLLLEDMNISQRDFADLTKLTESAISHYIKGDRAPNALTLINITNATKVSPNWLLGYGPDDQIERLN